MAERGNSSVYHIVRSTPYMVSLHIWQFTDAQWSTKTVHDSPELTASLEHSDYCALFPRPSVFSIGTNNLLIVAKTTLFQTLGETIYT